MITERTPTSPTTQDPGPQPRKVIILLRFTESEYLISIVDSFAPFTRAVDNSRYTISKLEPTSERKVRGEASSV